MVVLDKADKLKNDFLILKGIINILIGIPLSLGFPIYFAWVLTFQWNWYIVPITHWEPLNVFHAMGVCFFIGAFRAIWSSAKALKKKKSDTEEKDESYTWTLWKEIVVYYSVTSISLFMGWSWHWGNLFNN